MFKKTTIASLVIFIVATSQAAFADILDDIYIRGIFFSVRPEIQRQLGVFSGKL